MDNGGTGEDEAFSLVLIRSVLDGWFDDVIKTYHKTNSTSKETLEALEKTLHGATLFLRRGEIDESGSSLVSDLHKKLVQVLAILYQGDNKATISQLHTFVRALVSYENSSWIQLQNVVQNLLDSVKQNLAKLSRGTTDEVGIEITTLVAASLQVCFMIALSATFAQHLLSSIADLSVQAIKEMSWTDLGLPMSIMFDPLTKPMSSAFEAIAIFILGHALRHVFVDFVSQRRADVCLAQAVCRISLDSVKTGLQLSASRYELDTLKTAIYDQGLDLGMRVIALSLIHLQRGVCFQDSGEQCFLLTDEYSNIQQRNVDFLWRKIHTSDAVVQKRSYESAQSETTNKRKKTRTEEGTYEAGAPASEAEQEGNASSKTKAALLRPWRAGVERLFSEYGYKLPSGGVEKSIESLLQDTDNTSAALNVMAYLGCERAQVLSSDKVCSVCDLGADLASSRLLSEVALGFLVKKSESLIQENNMTLCLASLKALTRLIHHTDASRVTAVDFKPLYPLLDHPTRSIRMASSHTLLSLIQTYEACGDLADIAGFFAYISRTRPVKETTVILVGMLCRKSSLQGRLEELSLEFIVRHLADHNVYIKSLARSTLTQASAYKNMKPYALIQPHFSTISPILINAHVDSTALLNAAIACFNQPKESLLRITRKYTLPSLVENNRREMILQISNASKISIPVMLTESSSAAAILSHVFLMQNRPEQKRSLSFYMEYVSMARGSESASSGAGASTDITLGQIIEAIKVPLIYNVTISDSRDDEKVAAIKTIESTAKQTSAPVLEGEVLKTCIVGILSYMNRSLNEPATHSSVAQKVKVLKALQFCIEKIGPVIADHAPQIIATLLSAIEVPKLRLAALTALTVFLQTLKYRDIGPYVGLVTSVIVRMFKMASPNGLPRVEEELCAKALAYITDNAQQHLTNFVQDIADLSGFPPLEKSHDKVVALRANWSFSRQLNALLDRCMNESDVICLQALTELKQFIVSKTQDLVELTRGDVFDKQIGKTIKTLLFVITKETWSSGFVEEIRSLSFECVGLLGALDPDRLEFLTIVDDEDTKIVLEDFTNAGESVDFALHLIRDILVGAYRSTNDTKHQEFLAYAIQELLKFCGFSTDTIASNHPDHYSVRSRWTGLSKRVQEICLPLLGGSFSFKERSSGSLNPPSYPLYAHVNTYRDWIREWVGELIKKTTNSSGDSRGPQSSDDNVIIMDTSYAASIFSAFPPILHLEDIGVVRYLLPHLVLHIICSGSREDRANIKAEMECVLTDQLNGSSVTGLNENSRLLCAQTVFELMDHMSRYITKARRKRNEIWKALKRSKKADATATKLDLDQPIDNVRDTLQRIPYILVGQAALKCKAYARSLMNFELAVRDRQMTHEYKARRIVLRRIRENATVVESEDSADYMDDNDTVVTKPRHHHHKKLQSYYDQLHECYAHLDEPDGMEGISTKIIDPSLALQIREHESTGQWTSAQSCWELKLKKDPRNIQNYVGLLTCLRNLGHYDTMGGLLRSFDNDLATSSILSPFIVDSAVVQGDWDRVENVLSRVRNPAPELSFARVLVAMKKGDPSKTQSTVVDARAALGAPIVAAGKESYLRVYDSILNLHLLSDIERIYGDTVSRKSSSDMVFLLNSRLDLTSSSFKSRESVLSMRRSAFRAVSTPLSEEAIGRLWLQTAKIARKAGHLQTAYSAVLQAREYKAPFGFIESAKLFKISGHLNKAIQEIDYPLRAMTAIPPKTSQDGKVSLIAKASLIRARWIQETGRLEPNDLVDMYNKATNAERNWESPYYYIGHYWDEMHHDLLKGKDVKPITSASQRAHTCKLYSLALTYGDKYIYQTMPRLLIIWLEFGEDPDVLMIEKVRRAGDTQTRFDGEAEQMYHHTLSINKLMDRNIRNIRIYTFLTVLPLLVSRVMHPNPSVLDLIEKLLSKLLTAYPDQVFWAMASGLKSMNTKRAKQNHAVFQRAINSKNSTPHLRAIRDEGIRLVEQMLLLCNYNVPKNDLTMSMKAKLPSLYMMSSSNVIIPLQASLTVTLPNDYTTANYKPFPDSSPRFSSFSDTITIMPSLQKPRKITINGTDGLTYSFLCKPKDDLRKDARMMEFNSIIIKLLKKDSEARRRRLTIRTYAVVPVNEECGLIEWVPHVAVFRAIMVQLYATKNISSWTSELKKIFETIREDPSKTGERFVNEVQKQFPSVFHEWFLETFPEPTTWLKARLAYSRTYAVMCMVGFVIGLGDRHGENILMESTTGEAVHVDFNCMFDRGRTFDVPEQVPFRLTHNIVDGFGVTGVEGIFRKSCEITLRILRSNQDSLMSVLQTFVHDPLLEWDAKNTRRGSTSNRGVKSAAEAAEHNLSPVLDKLKGVLVTSDPKSRTEKQVSVSEQVERLIREARNPKNLGSMYVGWNSWL